MTRKRPEISRTGGLVCTDDVLHAWCEAKETKEIVCSTIPVLYLPTRREESTRGRRDDCLQHSTACTRVYSI